ncbi:hypothetical protein [Marinomonas communis]|uniref:hypothetical protein n=1 Tax=Marinomonas communis TaxID=28254 RepID=UPI001D17EE32|nr:hypothetical protein [Marinomonas communis]MCC4275994.1 hypothetical protein [Marinomonas communis]
MFTAIVVVLSLVFLIPSSGLSLLGLVFYLFIKFKSKHSRVESAIAQIAGERSGGYCVNIPYSEVVAYAQGSESITHVQGEMVTFLANIKGRDYEVTVNREPLGRKAIIESSVVG